MFKPQFENCFHAHSRVGCSPRHNEVDRSLQSDILVNNGPPIQRWPRKIPMELTSSHRLVTS